jgi:hypothetical protein
MCRERESKRKSVQGESNIKDRESKRERAQRERKQEKGWRESIERRVRKMENRENLILRIVTAIGIENVINKLCECV